MTRAPTPGIRNDCARPPGAQTKGGTARARTPGTFVLARFKGGAKWYPAQVMRAAGNLVTVQYGAGAQESLPSSLISDLNWRVGTYIECRRTGPAFVPVTITAMRANYAIDVVSNAGVSFATTMRSCRTVAR